MSRCAAAQDILALAYQVVSAIGTRASRLKKGDSHFVVQGGKDYRDAKFHLAVVIHNRAAELRHKIQEWQREGRNHPMIEVYEEEIKEIEAGRTHR